MTEEKTAPRACCAPKFPDDSIYKMPSVPGYPKLRAGTQLDAIYARFLSRGKGFRRPGTPEGLPKLLVVFDTQCIWSNRFWETAQILKDEVDFIWFPVCVSRDASTAQAAAILASDDPYALASETESLFNDPDFRGIRPEDYPVTQEQRNTAWENSRIYRLSGGTSVPLAIFRTPDNRYIPIFGDATPEEIRRITGAVHRKPAE